MKLIKWLAAPIFTAVLLFSATDKTFADSKGNDTKVAVGSTDGLDYNYETKTLTLDGYHGGKIFIQCSGNETVTMVLKGENNLTYDNNCGLRVDYANLKICGDGSLQVKPVDKFNTQSYDACGIRVENGSITIEDGTIVAEGASSTKYDAYGIKTQKIVMHGGSLIAKGGTVNTEKMKAINVSLTEYPAQYIWRLNKDSAYTGSQKQQYPDNGKDSTYAEITTKCPVTYTLAHINTDGTKYVSVGSNYNAKLTADQEYELPRSIEVKVNNETITGYSYNPKTGTLVIPASYLLGEVSIRASAVSNVLKTIIPSKARISMKEDEVYELNGIVLAPFNTKGQIWGTLDAKTSGQWKVKSGPAVITQNKDGNPVVKPTGVGKAYIYYDPVNVPLEQTDIELKSRRIKIRIESHPIVEKVTLSPEKVTLDRGSTQQLKASVSLKNTGNKTVFWSISDQKSKKTKISSSGLLTIGTDETAAKIVVKAISTDDKTKMATASVMIRKPQKISVVNATKAYGNKPFKLNAKTSGDGKITYKVQDKKIATVDANGQITIKGIGTTKITVYASRTDAYSAANKTVVLTVNPSKGKIKSLTAKYRALKVNWEKDSMVNGYEIQCSSKSSFKTSATTTIRMKKNKYTETTIKKLSKGKKYYVRMRKYKTIGKSTLYGEWSKVLNKKAK